ncbi:DNA-directed RNA polymerase subunit beta'' [Trichinella spiralis]|uniref:DNA-directed RNA polymerase subunit beta n=1 Tax=Trichinella spiralis TaxID=6334 RepID=A0ABR3KR13_TRISP
MLMDTGKRKETIADWERRNPVDPFMSNTGPPKPSKLFPKLKPRPFSYKILMSFRIGLGGPGLLSNSRIMSSAKAREATRSSLSVLSAFRNVLGNFCNATVND